MLTLGFFTASHRLVVAFFSSIWRFPRTAAVDAVRALCSRDRVPSWCDVRVVMATGGFTRRRMGELPVDRYQDVVRAEDKSAARAGFDRTG